MKLTSLLESDSDDRELERLASSGDQDALMSLAGNYLRINDPRMKGLIGSLRELNNEDAKDMIRLWAELNEILTAQDFVLELHNTRSGVNFDKASTEAEKAEFWLTFEDEMGRSGVAYGIEIWESPAGGRVWLVWGSDEENRFNYGVVDEEDYAWSKANDGILYHYRDYLY
jgi:hypothetical protein